VQGVSFSVLFHDPEEDIRMCNTVVLLALSGFLASPQVAGEVAQPGWSTDYSKAREQGRKEVKPLAVFIGSGKTGWQQLSQEGRLTKETKKLLSDKYICVYIDTNEAAGQRLAAAFEIPKGPGIVISTYQGDFQAFRHEGDLADPDLEKYLRRYADPSRQFRGTDTNPDHHSTQNEGYAPAPPVRRSYYAPVFQGGFGGRGC
jgi:hypothetical protein